MKSGRGDVSTCDNTDKSIKAEANARTKQVLFHNDDNHIAAIRLILTTFHSAALGFLLDSLRKQSNLLITTTNNYPCEAFHLNTN